MKRGYSKKKYHQRSKVETIFSVIKRTMGDEIRSVKTVAQNNEMRTKIICYSATRIVDMASSLFRGFLQSHFYRPVGSTTAETVRCRTARGSTGCLRSGQNLRSWRGTSTGRQGWPISARPDGFQAVVVQFIK
jgi:hypothetical protein